MNRPGLDYAFQVEWIRGRGLLLWLAMVMGAIGGGAFLVSAALEFRLGCTVGFLIAVVGKGSFHIAFLGRPERFWRAIWRPHSSWISRGIIFLGLFALVGLVYLALLWAEGVGEGAVETFRWASMVLAGLLITYDGFLMAGAPGIPFWNSSILPVLYGAAALLGGIGISLAFLPYTLDVVEPTLHDIEVIERFLLLGLAFLILSYLWTTFYTTSGARQSVRELLKGRVLGPFSLMLVMAIVVPAGVSISSLFRDLPYGVLSAAAVIAVGGEFSIKYTILRGGMYAPLTPRFEVLGERWSLSRTGRK